MSKVPQSPFLLMSSVYRKILPEVQKQLNYWKMRAEEIEDEELRKQALASINTKTFHCEGGSIYALLAREKRKEAITFIVAYQTISDYLDNLCDRSTSLDPNDFRCLHQAMLDCFTPGKVSGNYYVYRKEQKDNGYLIELVKTCQETIAKIENFDMMFPYLIELATLYGDLQVHKHVTVEERVPRLQKWFHAHHHLCPDLTWYEFSACTGSTLGVFCMISYGLTGQITKEHLEEIYKSYFPYMQGLHIMLDYFIDQEEDRIEGDLNFCSFYESKDLLEARLVYFMEKSQTYLHSIPDLRFHRLVQKGLVGLYLADNKVKKLNEPKMVQNLLKEAGFKSKFFYFNTKLYKLLRA